MVARITLKPSGGPLTARRFWTGACDLIGKYRPFESSHDHKKGGCCGASEARFIRILLNRRRESNSNIAGMTASGGQGYIVQVLYVGSVPKYTKPLVRLIKTIDTEVNHGKAR